ncbi:DUF6134 family protein [Humitalea sp. 24SJ18S-53]|uniref:DUF6134 family protein n=1 Tax=Humitalea sp. 24SJ18S-53 TaxID=3422307 RepID=UPI003D678F55
MMLHLPRRTALCLPLGLLARPAAAAPATVRFKVMREGREVGFHRVTVTQDGTTTRAVAEIEIIVRVMSFTVFSYRVQAQEVWRDGRLVSADSRSEKKGQPNSMVVRADAQGLAFQATGGNGRLPADAAPLTWWRETSMRGPLFDPATGALVAAPPRRTPLDGARLRWSVTADPGGEATYASPDGAWTGFSTRGEDGSAIVYQPA